MRQNLMVFTPNDPVFCGEYLCSCNLCLQFKFTECLQKNTPLYSDIPYNDDFGDFDDNKDEEVDRIEQTFNFVDVPSFVSLFSGSPNEPLYFVKVTEKGTASENHSDLYGHFISTGENFLKGFYLKLVRSRNASKKKYQLLPNEVVFSPDEVFDTYVEFSDDLHIDSITYNILIQKANSYILSISTDYCCIFGIFIEEALKFRIEVANRSYNLKLILQKKLRYSQFHLFLNEGN